LGRRIGLTLYDTIYTGSEAGCNKIIVVIIVVLLLLLCSWESWEGCELLLLTMFVCQSVCAYACPLTYWTGISKHIYPNFT